MLWVRHVDETRTHAHTPHITSLAQCTGFDTPTHNLFKAAIKTRDISQAIENLKSCHIPTVNLLLIDTTKRKSARAHEHQSQHVIKNKATDRTTGWSVDYPAHLISDGAEEESTCPGVVHNHGVTVIF